MALRRIISRKFFGCAVLLAAFSLAVSGCSCQQDFDTSQLGKSTSKMPEPSEKEDAARTTDDSTKAESDDDSEAEAGSTSTGGSAPNDTDQPNPKRSQEPSRTPSSQPGGTGAGATKGNGDPQAALQTAKKEFSQAEKQPCEAILVKHSRRAHPRGEKSRPAEATKSVNAWPHSTCRNCASTANAPTRPPEETPPLRWVNRSLSSNRLKSITEGPKLGQVN